MAVAQLVAYTTGSDESTDQTVASGAVHTLVPIFQGGGGRVVVQLKNSSGKYTHLKTLSSRDTEWQVFGPADYIVKVKKAGCDVNV